MSLSTEPVFLTSDLPYASVRYNRFYDALCSTFPRIFFEPEVIDAQGSSVSWQARAWVPATKRYGNPIRLRGGTQDLFKALALEFQLVTYPWGPEGLYTRPLSE